MGGLPHYRKRTKEEGHAPDIAAKYNCKMLPGSQTREKGTLQTASVSFKKDIEEYGDKYYIVVRCEGGWAASIVQNQRFAIVVELSHEAEIQLYQRMQVKVNA